MFRSTYRYALATRGMSTGEFVFILSLLMNCVFIFIIASHYIDGSRFGSSAPDALAAHLSDKILPAGASVTREAVTASEHALSETERAAEQATKKIESDIKK